MINYFDYKYVDEECLKIKHWIFQTLIVVLITSSLATEISSLMTAAMIISLVYVILADDSSCIILLMSLTIFENSFVIGNFSAWVFIVLVWLAKHLIISRRIYYAPADAILAVFILIILQLCTDGLMIGIGLTTFAGILLIVLLFMLFTEQFEIHIVIDRVIIYFGTSFLCAIYYLLQQYGGINGFLQSFYNLSDTGTDYYRFGLNYGDAVGGAMALPIYALMILSLSLCFMNEDRKQKSFFTRLSVIFFSLIAFIFGALTVSRSFFMGMTIIIIMYFISRSNTKMDSYRKIFIFISIIIIGLFLVNQFYNVVHTVINNLFIRISTDSTGGTGQRSEIWGESIGYLMEHPLMLLLGGGQNGYVVMGEKLGLLFGKGTHNIFLDILMSWGLVGFIGVITIVKQLINTKNIKHMLKINAVFCIPLFVLIAFSFTAMRSSSLKPYIYYFVTAMIIQQKVNTN